MREQIQLFIQHDLKYRKYTNIVVLYFDVVYLDVLYLRVVAKSFLQNQSIFPPKEFILVSVF